MKLRIFFTALVALLLFSDCQKYTDGPTLSIRPKTLRVVNSWQFNEASRNGLNILYGNGQNTLDYNASTIGFDDRNRFSYDFTFIDTSLTLGTKTFRGDGDWALISDDAELQLTFDSIPSGMPFSSPVQSYTILRLQENFLWLELIDNNSNSTELHLIPN